MNFDQNELKRQAALKAVEFVKNNMLVGLGTGSTAKFVVEELGKQVKLGQLKVKATPTSVTTKDLAMSFGIEMLSLEEIVDGDIDLVIDGADQIDLDSGICIKGGGGAHYWEKMVAEKSKKVVIVVDESKIVNDFAGYKIPLEIKEESKEAVAAKLDVVYREGKSDFGNLIADVVYDGSVSILEFEDRLLRIEGVIETGIFASLVDIVIVARNNGEVDVVEIDYT